MNNQPELPGRKRNKTSATQQIFETLQKEILSGRITAGELLSEEMLAERFGVSRTPVRRALGMLASDGLVNTLPKRGHQVRSVSLGEVREAFYLRELLELEAVSLAVQRMSDAEMEELFRVHNSIWRRFTGQNIADIHFEEAPATNREFHMMIAHASGNRLLAEFIDLLLKRMEQVMTLDPNLHGPPPENREGYEEELVLLQAMSARDEKAAREAMRKHIRGTLNAILRVD